MIGMPWTTTQCANHVALDYGGLTGYRLLVTF